MDSPLQIVITKRPDGSYKIVTMNITGTLRDVNAVSIPFALVKIQSMMEELEAYRGR